MEVLRRASGRTDNFPREVVYPNKEPVCKGCAEGKMTSSSLPASDKRAKAPFDKIHMDLKSLPTNSYRHYKYYIVFFDDNSSFGWITLLKAKSDADSSFRQFHAMVKNQFGQGIKEIMIDAGGEFKSDTLTEFLKDLGINILTSVPHMHQQNGRAERFIRTIMDKAQSMRFEACIPPSWWEFSVLYALHIYNRTPLKRTNWCTPYENLHKAKPDVAHLRVFGCGAYVFVPEDVRVNKLSPKAELMTFLGIPDGTKGYLFMRGPNNVLFTAVKALFDETLYPRCPDKRRSGTQPVDPEPQDEHNIPSGNDEDNYGPDEGGEEDFGDLPPLPPPHQHYYAPYGPFYGPPNYPPPQMPSASSSEYQSSKGK
jgi:hypothetical protein